MSEHKQQLSALLDGELSYDEIRRLQPDVEAAKFSTTSRYQMIADAIRGGDVGMIDISQQVRVAILQEAKLESNTPARNAVKAGWPGFSWLHPAGGMAVAASVALVLVLAVSITGESPEPGDQLASQNPGQYNRLVTTPVMAQQVVLPVGNDVRPDMRPNLNSYLKAHSEFAAQDTALGRMPYARAVTYESRN